jgi:hypothetical protein
MALVSNYFVCYSSDTLWDPFTVLEMPNLGYGGGVTCLGYARTAGRRCRNPINQSNRARARDILEYISEQPPRYSKLLNYLQDLAEICLCLRWHTPGKDPKQMALLLSQWRKALELEWKRYKADEYSKTVEHQDVEPESSSRKPAISAKAESESPFSCPVPKALPASNPTTNITSYVLNVPPHRAAEHALSSSTATTSRLTRESSSHIGLTTATRTRQAIGNPPETPTSNNSVQFIEREAGSPEISISPPESIQRTATIPTSDDQSSPCESRHVKRQNIHEDCIICKESCLGVPLNELTWCKSTCGHNVHRACFEDWRPWAERSREGLRCALW